MTTNPPVEPRKVVPDQDCPDCLGTGTEEIPNELTSPTYITCLCVLDQLTSDDEPFVIDTTPNDLTKWADVVEP